MAAETSGIAAPSMSVAPTRSRLTVGQLTGYGVGEAATSLIMNGLFGFALIFYTEALGLNPALAGLALSVSVFWEAVTEPAMGYISDRTNSRFGRRLPWIALGAGTMSVCFVMLWYVPSMFRTSQMATFGYLLGANIALRTALTMFVVPYLALGFELASDPEDRSRLQSVRWVFNMTANLFGPALAWLIFFPKSAQPGATLGAEMREPANYQSMALTFAVAVLVLSAILIAASWRARRSSTGDQTTDHFGFIRTYRTVLSDRVTLAILGALLVFVISMVLVSSIQTYVYVHYMLFDSWEKALVAGSGMVGAALGSLAGPLLIARSSKIGALLVGCLIGIFAQVLSAALFLTGWVSLGSTTALVAFIALQGLYWGASGVVLPVTTSLMGDAAQAASCRFAQPLDGAYSGSFSLVWRVGTSISLLVSGLILAAIGVHGTAAALSDVVATRLAASLFAMGSAGYLVALCWIVVMRHRLVVAAPA